MSYNGWKNYETWNVALWLDQATQKQCSEMAQSAYNNAKADGTFTRLERAKLDLANSLKAWIEESNPLADTNSMFSDMLNAALGEVDWYELAGNFLEDVEEEVEEEEVADEE